MIRLSGIEKQFAGQRVLKGVGLAMAAAAYAKKEGFAEDGYRLVVNCNEHGGQTVFHFHLHMLPRHVDDGMHLTWPRKEPGLERLQALCQRPLVHVGAELARDMLELRIDAASGVLRGQDRLGLGAEGLIAGIAGQVRQAEDLARLAREN